MMYWTFSVALLLFVSCGPTPSDAWGRIGHQVINGIAWSRMTETAKNAVAKAIGTNNVDFPSLGPIPDDYCHSPPGKWSCSMHYVDMPANSTTVDVAKDCPVFCNVKSVTNYTKWIDSGNSCVDGKWAGGGMAGGEPCPIVYLSHFIADMHQPLHVAWTDDRGGNLVKITFFGKDANLHGIWDDNMIERHSYSVENWTSELQTIIANEPDVIDEILSVTEPVKWADESFDYVRTGVYIFNPTMIMRDSVPALGTNYYETNILVVKQRLLAAGVRLAWYLNQMYGKK